MGRTPFYRTLNELKHHFSNIERTRTCSSFGNRTRTPYFWLRMIEHRTLNIVRPITSCRLFKEKSCFGNSSLVGTKNPLSLRWALFCFCQSNHIKNKPKSTLCHNSTKIEPLSIRNHCDIRRFAEKKHVSLRWC